VSFSDLLESFARLLDFFDKEVRERRDKLDTNVESAWNAYFKADSPSFNNEIDILLKTVLELNLKTITLLYEKKLELSDKDTSRMDGDSLKQYQRQWARAQKRLRKLQDRIFEIDQRLGEDETIVSLSQQIEARQRQAEKIAPISIQQKQIEKVEIAEETELEETIVEEDPVKPEVVPQEEDIQVDQPPQPEPENEIEEEVEEQRDITDEPEDVDYEEEDTDLVEIEEIPVEPHKELDTSSEVIEEAEQLSVEDEIPEEQPEPEEPFVEEEMELADLTIDEVDQQQEPEPVEESETVYEPFESISIEEGQIESSGLEEMAESEDQTADEQSTDGEEQESLDVYTPDETFGMEEIKSEKGKGEFNIDSIVDDEGLDSGADDLLSEDDKMALQEAESILSGISLDDEDDQVAEVEIEDATSDVVEEAVETPEEKSEKDDPQEVDPAEKEMEGKPVSLKIAALQEKLAPFKKIYSEKGDLKIKTRTGEWTLSLPYYDIISKDGRNKRLLDVENFIGLHNLAIKGVEEVQRNMAKGDSSAVEVVKMLTKLQKYFKKLYANVHEVIGPEGERIFPDMGDEFDPDSLIMIETSLSMEKWEEVDDLLAFKENFDEVIAGPFRSYVSEPENRLAYFESIAAIGGIG
jgi:hypothetical protein